MNGTIFWVKQESVVVQVLPEPNLATSGEASVVLFTVATFMTIILSN